MQVKWITIDHIKPNRYNPNAVTEPIMAKLRAEIGQKGLCEPIIVRNRDNAYEIIDGEHRWRICQELGWKEIPCIVQDYDDTEAKLKTLQLNYMRGSVLPIKLAHLIHDLNKENKLENLAQKLPYEKPQLQDYLELLKLPDGYGKQLLEKSKEEQKELPSVITFVVYKKELQVIEEALNKAMQVISKEAKNRKAIALESICTQFLKNEEVIENSPETQEIK